MSRSNKNTPMMEQYLSIKDQYPDSFLFFRLGDFYELFNEDAIEASKILEITLTSRNKNAENPIPMCGVPYHSATEYIKKLITEGHKVAICEQVEDPKLAKGMVKREVVRIITPGTIIEEDAIPNKENNYIAAIKFIAPSYILTYTDISTGEIYLTQTDDWVQFLNEIQSVSPSEVVLDTQFEGESLQALKNALKSYFSIVDETELNNFTAKWQLEDATPGEKAALDLLTSYIHSVQMQAINHLQPVERYKLTQYLQMNYYAKSQLELTRSLRTQRKKGSLLWFLDHTKTAMGGRLLHQWLDKPLLTAKPLSKRHDKVEQLINHYFERVDLISALENVYDLERLVTKISLGNANARDIDQLRMSLKQIPVLNQILNLINQDKTQLHSVVFESLNEFRELVNLIDTVLVDEPPISVTEGELIRDNYNEQLDTYRDALNNGQRWLAELQQRERNLTGLKTLKVGFNKVFGYYIEISRIQAQNLMDDRYQRKQTLANSERYITDELKEIETTILEAQEKAESLEYELFVQLRQNIAQYVSDLQMLANQVAELDILCNFASLSEEDNYTRATITTDSKSLSLRESRHPVVEKLLGQAEFVPNDVTVTPDNYLLLLTGPNMSGKSTFMRQIAYCVILNQIGCFVPAKEATLPLIDKIFTRIGSSDDISSGQSTFMVEMMETNVALEQATSNSLLLFDEIGRGTATYDGMALAQGIIEYIASSVHAITIFSTHYHELTELDQKIDVLKNIHVGAIEHDGEVIFLHQILEGPADKSYGIHVAKLAGLPNTLIHNSQEILANLEANAQKLYHSEGEQLSLFEAEKPLDDSPNQQELQTDLDDYQEIINQIKELNLNNMTPLEAMQVMAELQAKTKELN